MSELALKLIAENKAKHARGEDARYLDLGKCGLSEVPDLSDMDWLETLIVSNEWWDYEQREWIKSQNTGLKNKIARPPVRPLPNSLKRVVLGGEPDDKWPISDGRFLGNLIGLTSLNLRDNGIKNLHFLKKLTNLTDLNLSDKKISDVNLLGNLNSLKKLYIHDCQITNGDFLKGLTNLQSLYLGSNQISKVDFLHGLGNLQTLYLGNNQISDGDFLQGLSNLQTLDLSNNQISNGDFLQWLPNLQTLDLSYNQISDGDFIQGLSNLQTLGLSYNKISDGDFIQGLSNLQTLDLSYNQISNGDFLQGLSNLQTLDLSYNQISNGDFLQGLTNLQTLDFSSNQISKVDFLQGLTNLQSLDLRSNQISKVDFLQGLTNLQTLDLSYNQISKADFLQGLTNLQTLDLRSNQISDGDFLQGLTNLQSLDLRNNQISNGDFLKNLTNLQSLDLRNNQITDIEPFLPLIKKGVPVILKGYDYSGINLFNNPLTNPPIEIVEQGNEVILKWLTSKNKRPILEAKIMFIGDSGFGKTHLIELLRNGALKRDISTTLGIERNQLAPASSSFGPVRLNVWDLGGQEFMRSTHQFFFTTRTLYVLVTDARQGERREEMRHWLNLVRTLGENAPVLVVINKIDTNDHDIDRESIQKEYPNVLGFVRACVYDAPTKGIVALETIAELKRQIDAIVSNQTQMPSVFYEQREEWFTVKNGLEKNSDPYITIEAYRKMDFISKLSTEEQDSCLRQLNFVGSVISYFDDARLSDTHVIDPKWIMDGVYAILTDTTVKEINKGKFDLRDMRRILSTEVYPDGKLVFLTNLMQKFRLCYPQRGSNDTFLLPDLFTDAEPAGIWQAENPLHFRFDYDDYPPDVFIAQFIAAKYKSIEGEKRWRSGVVICDGQCRAIVRRSFRRDAIDIEVVGPEKQQRGFLRMIREVLYELHEPFSTLKPKEVIPYKDQWLDYWDLLKAEADGDRTYRIIGGERIQLSEVLDGYAVDADRDSLRRMLREEIEPLLKKQEQLLELNIAQLELLEKNEANRERLFQTLDAGFISLLEKLPAENPIAKQGNAYLAATDMKLKLKIGHELLGGQLEAEVGIDAKKIFQQLKKDAQQIIQDFRDGHIFVK